MPSDLKELFERTLPREEEVLKRMAFARMRSEQSRKSLLHDVRIWVFAAASLATCATVLVLLKSRVPSAQLEPERLDPPSRNVRLVPTEANSASATEVTPTSNSSELVKSSPGALTEVRPKRAPSPAVPAVRRAPATWEAAARAMRSGDQLEAQRLLAELSNSQDPEVRDSALLVRLRSALNAASANSERPRLSAEEEAQLEALVHSGATPSIRANARKLLEKLSL